MRQRLLDLLVCPVCGGTFRCVPTEQSEGRIISGTLECERCSRAFPIVASIPRFVAASNYASSFGFQWNAFRSEQLDSKNGTTISRDRFLSETGWSLEDTAGEWILDVGCGAGRFLDVVSRYGCEVVGVDLSVAVDAALSNLGDRENLHLVQASVYDLPFAPASFDRCYCIGMLQHTPDPRRTLETVAGLVRPGGRVAVTAYERKWMTPLAGKYLLRAVTKRLPPRVLLVIIRSLMPLLFPVTELLFRLPLIGRASRYLIPVSNYVHERQLTLRQRYRWAILDTFDALAPTYDSPLRATELRTVLARANFTELHRLENPGINLVGRAPLDTPTHRPPDAPRSSPQV